jgi:hypothetical protein
MTAVELAFTILAIAAFAATAWITGIIAWRLVKGPKR